MTQRDAEVMSAGSRHALQHVLALAAKLTCADDDGRIITAPDPCTLKFVLLNAAAHFSQASAWTWHLVLWKLKPGF